MPFVCEVKSWLADQLFLFYHKSFWGANLCFREHWTLNTGGCVVVNTPQFFAFWGAFGQNATLDWMAARSEISSRVLRTVPARPWLNFPERAICHPRVAFSKICFAFFWFLTGALTGFSKRETQCEFSYDENCFEVVTFAPAVLKISKRILPQKIKKKPSETISEGFRAILAYACPKILTWGILSRLLCHCRKKP